MDSDYNERLTDQEEEKIITIHEFGHLYNPGNNLDHYGSSGCTSTALRNQAYNTDLFSKNCTYGENNYADGEGNALVMSNFVICPGCKQWINGERSNYMHTMTEVP